MVLSSKPKPHQLAIGFPILLKSGTAMFGSEQVCTVLDSFNPTTTVELLAQSRENCDSTSSSFGPHCFTTFWFFKTGSGVSIPQLWITLPGFLSSLYHLFR